MPTDIHSERILIIDFGSQYTQLIARRVRELGVYCEIYSHNVSPHDIEQFSPSGIILSGGPETVTANNTPRATNSVFELGCPVLGICYGMQTMAQQLGGEVKAATIGEFGYATVVIQQETKLLKGIEDNINEQGQEILEVWMSHGDQVIKVPEGFKIVANTEDCEIAVMSNEEKRFYGLQFHPEVTHCKQGKRILERFVREICGCVAAWTAKNIAEDLLRSIKEQVGDEKVLLALSGGVDSSVLATLLHKAIGDKLICVFVDTGLLRLNEAEEVMSMLEQHFGIHIIHVNAEQRFLSALTRINEPEQKRKIIGKLFIELFEEQAKNIAGVRWLAQGTVYSDVIESAGSNTVSHAIKSHHNVGGLPERMQLKLLEPLRELFKDEVRMLGLELGLPYEMVYRHPFPGPGLAVRILGEVKPEFIDLLRRADAIFIEELKSHGFYHKVAQAFAVFLPVRSVGVMGDARKYDYVISLRAVESVDFMTARWAHLPHNLLEMVSNRIINEISGIARVTYDISNKPPATIEWE